MYQYASGAQAPALVPEQGSILDALPSGKRSRGDSAFLKMLLSNMSAGTLTGRGGQFIQEVERSTQAQLKLSKQGQLYPGTQDRICIIAGDLSAVDQVIKRILGVIKEVADSGKDHSSGQGGRMIAKLVLPNSAATTIIGAGGANINRMTQQSQADIKFSEKGQCSVPNQRILVITGTFDQVSMVCSEVLCSIQEDPHLEGIMVHDGVEGAQPLSRFGGGPPVGAFSSSQQLLALSATTGFSAGLLGSGMGFANSALLAPVEIAFDVSEMMAGTIVGRGGGCIQNITQTTKANVQLSNKNAPPLGLMPGMRRVTITGTLNSVQAAHIMVVSKMLENPPPGDSGPWGIAPGNSKQQPL